MDPSAELISSLHELNACVKKNSKLLHDLKDLLQRQQGERAKVDTDGYENARMDRVSVEIRVVFLKIGEIDTLKEQFQAEAYIQARWKEPAIKLTDMESFEPARYWNPGLFIENAVGDIKQETWHRVVVDGNGDPFIYEMRKAKGTFLENLELNDFPVDVQDLSITVTTTRTSSEVVLIEDAENLSTINTQAFIDQQEWRLHEHVETKRKITTTEFSHSKNKHPALSFTCRAARRPGYFYWNVFFLMFFITVTAFTTFSVNNTLPQNRLQLAFTLLLTAVTFKWVVNRCLPTISYLTSLDKYVLASMVMLCVVCSWHALVTTVPDRTLGDYYDRVALGLLAIMYLLFHIAFAIWMYFTGYKRRRLMKLKDKEYLEKLGAQQNAEKNSSNVLLTLFSATFSPLGDHAPAQPACESDDDGCRRPPAK